MNTKKWWFDKKKIIQWSPFSNPLKSQKVLRLDFPLKCSERCFFPRIIGITFYPLYPVCTLYINSYDKSLYLNGIFMWDSECMLIYLIRSIYHSHKYSFSIDLMSISLWILKIMKGLVPKLNALTFNIISNSLALIIFLFFPWLSTLSSLNRRKIQELEETNNPPSSSENPTSPPGPSACNSDVRIYTPSSSHSDLWIYTTTNNTPRSSRVNWNGRGEGLRSFAYLFEAFNNLTLSRRGSQTWLSTRYFSLIEPKCTGI